MHISGERGRLACYSQSMTGERGRPVTGRVLQVKKERHLIRWVGQVKEKGILYARNIGEKERPFIRKFRWERKAFYTQRKSGERERILYEERQVKGKGILNTEKVKWKEKGFSYAELKAFYTQMKSGEKRILVRSLCRPKGWRRNVKCHIKVREKPWWS